MATMSFMEEMKDKAARLIPSAYSDILEETTSDVLLAPNYQNIVFLCDSANANPENVTDIIRAVRRRIDHKSAKVQFFTIQVLDSLIKNCGPSVHLEIADTKGLLHDLFLAATKKPSRDGEREANTAALTLILNMSLWFSGHSDDRLKVLMELADHVRKVCGSNAFEGIEPDINVQLRRSNQHGSGGAAVSSQARQEAAAVRRQRRQEQEYLRLQQEHAFAQHQQHHQQHQQQRGVPQTVKAIPLIIPTEEEVSGMLDACLVLAECLNTAETQGSPIIGDELIGNLATQIRRDHRGLAMILSSGAEIPNMDVLFSVTDSQTSTIQRLSDLMKVERSKTHPQQPQTAAGGAGMPQSLSNDRVTATTSSSGIRQSSEDFFQQQQQQQVQHGVSTAPPQPGTQPTVVIASTSSDGHRRNIRQAADVDEYEDVEMQATPHAVTKPTMDDLFGGTTQPATAAAAATAPSKSPPPQSQPQAAAHVSSAFPQPMQSVDHQTAAPSAMSHQETVVPSQPGTSLNDDEADEFDNFLNSRLRK